MPSLEGWDTLSALPISFVNAALAQHSASIIGQFSFTGGGSFNTPYTCTGTFGPFAIARGINTTIINLQMPVASGTIQTAQTTVDLAGVVVIMAVSLTFIQGSAVGLSLDLAAAGKYGTSPQPGLVTPLSLTGPPAVLTLLGQAGIQDVLDGFAQTIVEHAQPLQYFFAELNDTLLPQEAWLQATAYAYSYLLQTSGDDYLAISTMVAGHSAPATVNVDASFLPPAGSSANSATAITGDLFLQQLIMPQLPQAFQGRLSAGNLSFDSAQHRIVNSTPFDLAQIQVGLIWYTPTITSLVVNNQENAIQISLSGNCDLYAGISMSFSFQASPSLSFSGATQTLTFLPDPNPISSHHADVPWWWFAGGLIVEAVVQAVVAVISSDLGDDLTSLLNTQSISGVQTNVNWSDATHQTVLGVALDNSFSTLATLT
ncbi:TULIP family P47-like protein [Deinococcus sp. Leaf326]|uniref:TULIP family P47-like protein n=1 Tax=Deinococcus sp. Leaf326 TaxID=1736338 RepID=UPI0006FDEEC9|nr:TULIP family P47-like protein [Deinococcus sp. Leaf326]KQR18755.1 hypothetical protein ASF71_20125 [Deinococcus sp. Leaf326]